MIQVTYKMGHKGDDTSWTWVQTVGRNGDVGVLFSIKNIGEQTIKYYTLYFIAYNSVEDAVSYDGIGNIEYGIKCPGPLSANQAQIDKEFANIWRDPYIKRVELSRAEIEYMDGTKETIQGSQITEIKGGCYVATAVYGSYDCPEVWTLRRYRDYELGETWYGKAFIKLYYTISPILVRKFGKTKWFKKMWRGTLDNIVIKLRHKGFESTPYKDKEWN